MYVEVFIDGAARYNNDPSQPTEAACACVIYVNKVEVYHFARALGNRSNNEAEYEALITALLVCSAIDYPRPIIYSDSQLVVNHTTDKWKCKTPSLLPYYMTVKSMKTSYPFDLIKVPRSRVFLADQLCNQVLDDLFVEHANLNPSAYVPES